MFDSFPFSEWSTEIADFWTFGPAGSTGTWIILALGLAFCLYSIVAFVRLENGKLDSQAEKLRRAGGLDTPGHPANQ